MVEIDNIEIAAMQCQRMWRRLGRLYERLAYDAAKEGKQATALEAARRAEACFWQAAGEEPCIRVKDFPVG